MVIPKKIVQGRTRGDLPDRLKKHSSSDKRPPTPAGDGEHEPPGGAAWNMKKKHLKF